MCATTALPPLPQNPPVPDDPAAQTARLLIALRAISHELEVQSHRSDREIGLTLPQLLVLSHIRDFSAAADADEPAPGHALTGRGIAKAMALSAPTVVGILDNLEARGMIQRQRSVRDRRNIVTRLTPRAHQVLTDAPPLLGSDFARRFAAMAPDDRAATIHAVDRVAALFRTLPDSA